MRKYTLLLAAASALALGACKRTAGGDVVVDRPSDVTVKTTQDTLHMPTMTTRTDTINSPVVGFRDSKDMSFLPTVYRMHSLR